MKSWLTPSLIDEVKAVYEPRYGRKLRKSEAVDIAKNLTAYMEVILKHKANVYGNDNPRPRVC